MDDDAEDDAEYDADACATLSSRSGISVRLAGVRSIKLYSASVVVLYCTYSTYVPYSLELRYRFGSHIVLEAHRYLSSL